MILVVFVVTGTHYHINDIEESNEYPTNEVIYRCKLATLFRLVDNFGWTQTVFNHISVS